MAKKDIVRDGRIQAPKKRTDRSYLNTTAAPAPPAPEPEQASAAESVAVAETADAVTAAPVTVGTPPAPQATAPAAPVRHAGAVRALEQQGVRKRRELNVDELARRDTAYAKHELRRIAIFAGLIFAVLIVLAIFLA